MRDFPWVNLPLVLGGLSLSGLGAWRAFRGGPVYRGKVLGSLGLGLSLLLAVGFNLYVFWLSYQMPRPADAALAMTVAPDFTLRDQSGQDVSLRDLRGRKVVLVFYRGYW